MVKDCKTKKMKYLQTVEMCWECIKTMTPKVLLTGSNFFLLLVGSGTMSSGSSSVPRLATDEVLLRLFILLHLDHLRAQDQNSVVSTHDT